MHLEDSRFSPEKLAMCVHSSITPFMKHSDSFCSECCWPDPRVMLLACSMSKWGPLLLTADSIWSNPSLSLLPISRVESGVWRPEHEAEERSPIWSLSDERMLNRSWVRSRSESLSKLPGAFFTNSWPIRKESVWNSKAWLWAASYSMFNKAAPLFFFKIKETIWFLQTYPAILQHVNDFFLIHRMCSILLFKFSPIHSST